MMRQQFDVATLEEKAHADPSARQWQGRRRDWHNFKWIRVEGVKIIQNSRDLRPKLKVRFNETATGYTRI